MMAIPALVPRGHPMNPESGAAFFEESTDPPSCCWHLAGALHHRREEWQISFVSETKRNPKSE